MPAGLLGPQRCRREIGEGLADARFRPRRAAGSANPSRAWARTPASPLRPSLAGPRAARSRPVSRSSLVARLGRDRPAPCAAAAARPLPPTASSRENSMRSPRSGRSSRRRSAAPSPSPSRCSVAFDGPRAFALAPVGIVEHCQQALGDPLAATRPPRPRLPAAPARAPGSGPPTVGTANRAGWMKANSSSRSSPHRSG